MIARIWHGWAPPATADGYQRHYESEISGHLQGVGGYERAVVEQAARQGAKPLG